MSALSFLSLKSFHPKTKANQRKLWIAQQNDAEKQKRKEEYKKRLLEQQELFATKKNDEQTKLSNLQDLETLKKRKHQLMSGQGDDDAPAKKKRKRSRKNKKKKEEQNPSEKSEQNLEEDEEEEEDEVEIREGPLQEEAKTVEGPKKPESLEFVTESGEVAEISKKETQIPTKEKEISKKETQILTKEKEIQISTKETEISSKVENNNKKKSSGPTPNSVAAALFQFAQKKETTNFPKPQISDTKSLNFPLVEPPKSTASPFISVKPGENVSKYLPASSNNSKMKSGRNAQFPEKPKAEEQPEIQFIPQDKTGIPKPLTFIPQISKKPEEMFTYIPKNNFSLTEKFPFLKNAPKQGKYVESVSARHQPFGIQLRDVRCTRCGGFGHSAGDRECPFKDVNPLDFERRKMEDPLAGHSEVKDESIEGFLANLSEEEKGLLIASLSKEKKTHKGRDLSRSQMGENGAEA